MNHRSIGIGMLWIAMALLSLASSCSSRKPMVTPAPHADYQWMTAKMTIQVESSDTTSTAQFSPFTLSGTLRMRRDSAIWVSASAVMGIESVRALVTQDSVVMVNRLNQTYLLEPLAKVEEKLHTSLTLQEAQSKLLGNGATDHVEIQFGPYIGKIRYADIRWDEPTTFPIKINKSYERIIL